MKVSYFFSEQYITDVSCADDVTDAEEADARSFFPSGHASLAVYSATFLVVSEGSGQSRQKDRTEFRMSGTGQCGFSERWGSTQWDTRTETSGGST